MANPLIEIDPEEEVIQLRGPDVDANEKQTLIQIIKVRNSLNLRENIHKELKTMNIGSHLLEILEIEYNETKTTTDSIS